MIWPFEKISPRNLRVEDFSWDCHTGPGPKQNNVGIPYSSCSTPIISKLLLHVTSFVLTFPPTGIIALLGAISIKEIREDGWRLCCSFDAR